MNEGDENKKNENTDGSENEDNKITSEVPKHNRVKYEDDDVKTREDSFSEGNRVFSRTTQQIIGPRTSQSGMSLQLSEIMRRDSFSFLYPGTDGDSYDYASERKDANSTIIPSIMHLVKGSLSCGFLCIHEAWKCCGLWTSLVMAVLIAILARYSYRMIGHSAQRTYERIRVAKLSYPQLAEAALALGPLRCRKNLCRRARHIMNVWIFLKIMGSLCIYEILMAKTLKHSLENLSPKINLSIRVYIVILVLPLIILSMIRNLRILVILATIADFYIILCIGIALYWTMLVPKRLGSLPAWRSVFGLFKFGAIFTYTIDGSYTILPTENHMRKPRYFYIVTDVGVLITATFVTSIGFVGYWGWGDKSESPITIHMANYEVFIIMQIILVIFFAILFTIHLFIPFEILWHYASKKFTWVKTHPRGARGVITVQVTLITCASVAWPHVIDMLCFLGVLCSVWLLFIVPSVIESFIYWEERKLSQFGKAKHSINIFYVLFGLSLFFGGIISMFNTFCTTENY